MLRSSQLVTFQRRSESGRGEERNDRPALSWCRTCYGTANPVGELWPRLSAYWAAATVPRHVRQPRLSPFLPPFRNFLAISGISRVVLAFEERSAQPRATGVNQEGQTAMTATQIHIHLGSVEPGTEVHLYFGGPESDGHPSKSHESPEAAMLARMLASARTGNMQGIAD